MEGLSHLSYELLIETIQKAKELCLDPEFIHLLEKELEDRHKYKKK